MSIAVCRAFFMRDIKVLCVTPLSSFVHFVYKCHFASAADAPSPSDFVCHLSWLLLAGLQKPLRLGGGRPLSVRLCLPPLPFHRESLPHRGKQETLVFCNVAKYIKITVYCLFYLLRSFYLKFLTAKY